MSDLHFNDTNNKSNELLVNLMLQCFEILRDSLEIDPKLAERVAWEISDRMSFVWGGQNIYIPKGVSYRATQRDKQIYAEFTGKNQADLAMKYGISVQWLYKIIKAVRADEAARRQGSLLLEAEKP